MQQHLTAHEWHDSHTVQANKRPTAQYNTHTMRPPTAYHKFKWKSRELWNEMKLRIIVTFAGHPLARWGHMIGRALGLIVRVISACTRTLSMPTMRGVRDIPASLVRLQPNWHSSTHAEIDMDDQYWAISRAQVKQAFEWGLSRLRNARHGHGPFDFSISALHKHLDRIGHATDHTFHIITESEVRSFLH